MGKKKMLKRAISGAVSAAMLITGMQLPAAAEGPAEYLPETELDEAYIDDGMFYLASAGAELAENAGTGYLLKAARYGDCSAAASVRLTMTDVTASYGKDYTAELYDAGLFDGGVKNRYASQSMLEVLTDDPDAVEEYNYSDAVIDGSAGEETDEAAELTDEEKEEIKETVQQTLGELTGGEVEVSELDEEQETDAQTDTSDIGTSSLAQAKADATGLENDKTPMDLPSSGGNSSTSVGYMSDKTEELNEGLKSAYLIIDFDEGESEKHIKITPIDNDKGEGDKMSMLALTGEENAETAGMYSNFTLNIIDDEETEDTVIEFSDAEYYPEDGYIKATVIRSGCMTNVVEVTLDTSDDTADGGRDYSEVHSEVTFPFGIEKRTINIPIRSQYLTDTARFKLTLSAPQGCVLGERAESFGIISPEDEGFAVESDETEMSVAASTDGIYLDSAIGWTNPSNYTGGTGSSSSYSKEINGNWVMYSDDGTYFGGYNAVASQCTTFTLPETRYDYSGFEVTQKKEAGRPHWGSVQYFINGTKVSEDKAERFAKKSFYLFSKDKDISSIRFDMYNSKGCAGRDPTLTTYSIKPIKRPFEITLLGADPYDVIDEKGNKVKNTSVEKLKSKHAAEIHSGSISAPNYTYISDDTVTIQMHDTENPYAYIKGLMLVSSDESSSRNIGSYAEGTQSVSVKLTNDFLRQNEDLLTLENGGRYGAFRLKPIVAPITGTLTVQKDSRADVAVYLGSDSPAKPYSENAAEAKYKYNIGDTVKLQTVMKDGYAAGYTCKQIKFTPENSKKYSLDTTDGAVSEMMLNSTITVSTEISKKDNALIVAVKKEDIKKFNITSGIFANKSYSSAGYIYYTIAGTESFLPNTVYDLTAATKDKSEIAVWQPAGSAVKYSQIKFPYTTTTNTEDNVIYLTAEKTDSVPYAISGSVYYSDYAIGGAVKGTAWYPASGAYVIVRSGRYGIADLNGNVTTYPEPGVAGAFVRCKVDASGQTLYKDVQLSQTEVTTETFTATENGKEVTYTNSYHKQDMGIVEISALSDDRPKLSSISVLNSNNLVMGFIPINGELVTLCAAIDNDGTKYNDSDKTERTESVIGVDFIVYDPVTHREKSVLSGATQQSDGTWTLSCTFDKGKQSQYASSDILYARITTDRYVGNGKTVDLEGKITEVDALKKTSYAPVKSTYYFADTASEKQEELSIQPDVGFLTLPIIGRLDMNLCVGQFNIGIHDIPGGKRVQAGYVPKTYGSGDGKGSALTDKHVKAYGLKNFKEGFSDLKSLMDKEGSENVFGAMSVGIPVWTIKPYGGLYFDFVIAQDASGKVISDGDSVTPITKQTFRFTGGGVYVGVAGNITYTYYMLVYGVPVYIGGSVTANILGEIGATQKNGISLSPADMYKAKTYSEDLSFDFCLRASVTGAGYAGIGICGVAGVRGGVEISVKFIFNPTITKLYPDMRTTGFNYSGTIKFWLDAVLATIPCPAWTFMSENTGYFEDMKKKNADIMVSSVEDKTETSVKPYVKPRAAGQSAWTANDSLSLQSTYSPISSRALNENGYDAPDQQIISLGENKALLVFLDDDPARTDENRTVLKYAVYDNGSWTEPTVLQDDGTADFDPNLCDAGDKVIISWTSREETELGSEVTTEYLKTMEVYTAVFDKSTAAAGEIVKLTDDDCYDSAPKAIYDSETGDVLVHYTKSEVMTDNFAEEAMVTLNNSEQAYMLYDGASGEWVRDRYFENELAEGADEDNLINNFGAQRFLRAPIEEFGINNPVITDFTASTLTTFELPDYYENYDFESMSDETFGGLLSYMLEHTSDVGVYAYTVDEDNSLDTDGDRELFIQYYDYKNHKTSDPIRITNNNVCDSSPMFAGNGNELYLFWLEDGGRINYIDLADILAGEVIDGVVSPNVNYNYGCVSTDKLEDGSEPAISGFTAFVDSDDDLFVAWVQPDEDEEGQSRGQEVYAASYIQSFGEDNAGMASWSDGVQLTDNGRINELPVFTALDGGSIMMINNQYNMDLSQEIYNTSDVQLTETVFKEVPSLKITDVEVNNIPENPGDKFTADITIKNTGLKDAYGFEINGGIRTNGADEADNAFTEKAETIEEYLERDPELEEFTQWCMNNCIPAGGSITITEEFTLSEEGAKDLSKIVCYADISEQYADGVISSECTVFDGEPEYEFENIEVVQNGDEFVLAGIIRNTGSAASESGDKLTAEFNNIYYQPVDGEVFAETELEPLEPGEFRSFEMNLTISEDKLVNGVTNGWITVKDSAGNDCADGTDFGVLLSNPYGLSVNGGAEELTVKAGEELELDGSYKGAGYFMNGRMLYTVDDTSTAAVSGNVLRGVSEGETTLKMTVNPFGGAKTVKVTVTEGDNPAPTPEPTEEPTPAPTQKPGSSGAASSGSRIGSTIAGGSSAIIPAVTQAPAANTGRFTDVRQGDWFFEAVESMAELGVVNGVTDTTFEPQTEVTRAMFAAMLHRYEGEPQTDYAMTFKDVPADAYYTEAVRWAASAGIITGYDDKTFAPEDRITREQAAAMLYRYAKLDGCDMSVGENTNILSYDDAFIISEYAIPALQWTAGFGVMSGRTDTTLNPLDNLTRAETTQVLYNYRTAYINSRNDREVTEIE